MSEAFKVGYSDGLQSEDLDGYSLSQKVDDYRVGYVIGYTDSEHAGTPPDYLHFFMGGNAAKAGISLTHFKSFIEKKDWRKFAEGYRSKDQGGDDKYDDQ